MKPCHPMSCPFATLRVCSRAASGRPPRRQPGARLVAPPGRADRLTHLEELPPREAEAAPWPAWVPDELRRRTSPAASRGRGGTRPRPPTSPGPAGTWWSPPAPRRASRWLSSCRHSRPPTGSRGPGGERGATALYLAPTKALAQDQLAGLRASGSTCAARPTTATPAASCAMGARPRRVRPHQPRHAPPLAAARACALGAVPVGSSTSSWSTRPTTTAASSAPTSPRSCAGCAGSARATARSRRSCWPRPPWPTRPARRAGSPGCRSWR